jgi:hypothetical protein
MKEDLFASKMADIDLRILVDDLRCVIMLLIRTDTTDASPPDVRIASCHKESELHFCGSHGDLDVPCVVLLGYMDASSILTRP